MNMQKLFKYSRKLTYKSEKQIPDDDLLIYTNDNYKKLVRKIIVDVNEDFFYEEWTTDLVVGQQEYLLEKATSKNQGMFKILQVEMLVNKAYRKLRANTLASMPYSSETYAQNKSISPFYRVGENSIFIYPTPNKNITNGLKIYGVKNAIDLHSNSTEEDFIIPSDYISVLAYMNAFQIFLSTGETNEANNIVPIMERKIQEMIDELNDRNLSPVEIILPSLKHLE